VLRIRDVYPGSDFFPSGSQKIVTKLLLSKLFIPDPDPDFYSSRIQDPGLKKAPDPAPQHFNSYFKSLTTVKYGTVVCLNLFDTGGYFL
jgi:hypothetical protein